MGSFGHNAICGWSDRELAVIGDQQAMELTNDLMRISVGQISGFQIENMGHDRTYITNIHGIVLCLGEVMFCHQIWGIGFLDRPLAIRYNQPFFKCIIQIWQWKKKQPENHRDTTSRRFSNTDFLRKHWQEITCFFVITCCLYKHTGHPPCLDFLRKSGAFYPTRCPRLGLGDIELVDGLYFFYKPTKVAGGTRVVFRWIPMNSFNKKI